MYIKFSFLIVFLFGVSVDAYSDPGACSGSCWVSHYLSTYHIQSLDTDKYQSHDPAVIQRTSDNKYFRFSTGSGIQITTASSIAGPWTIQGYALSGGSSIDLTGNTDLWVNL